jgi:hypothetical protein
MLCHAVLCCAAALCADELSQLPLPGDVDFLMGGPPCQGFSGLNRWVNFRVGWGVKAPRGGATSAPGGGGSAGGPQAWAVDVLRLSALLACIAQGFCGWVCPGASKVKKTRRCTPVMDSSVRLTAANVMSIG